MRDRVLILGARAALAVAVARSLEDDVPRRIEIRARTPVREPFYFEPRIGRDLNHTAPRSPKKSFKKSSKR